MTLKERFAKWWNSPTSGTQEEDLLELSQIAEDFAVGFSEWLLYEDITQRGKNNFVCEDGVQRSTKELLEVYKKQQNDTKGKV